MFIIYMVLNKEYFLVVSLFVHNLLSRTGVSAHENLEDE